MSQPKKDIPKSISYKGLSSTKRSIFNTKVNNDIKDLATCTPKELKEKLDKNNKLLENKDLVSKLPDKGQKLHERNILINELLEKHKSKPSKSSKPINELEELINKMSIDDNENNGKKSYAVSKITPVSLGSKKNGRFYNPDVKTNLISIEESIKLQEYQEKLQQKIQIHALSEKFGQITVDKKEFETKTYYDIDELENYISEESYNSLNSDDENNYS